ncbi:MAG TPA: efflux RND transporter periplasmic adaptor subunit [Phycisphaerae bacterium]|nr:efflux RND transporter periplasmic adaptor subunit [Phycisphaerae bacterium]HRW51769.1 efflux RND transporter periplasmic adaptor subunit [Phycisphaerae bacterium]
MNERTHEGRRLLARWALTLVCLLLMLTWATCRLNQARLSLETASGAGGASTDNAPKIDYWTCTMHPEVHENGPGNCPICGMELVAKYAGSDSPGVPPAPGASNAHSSGPHKQLYMCTMPECNDTPSEDPNSRCPVCGMKREPIGTTDAGNASSVELALNERAQKLAEVATEEVAPRRLFRHIRTVGKVGYDETRHKMVTAWMAGRIDRLYADYSGMRVAKGDHLVELYSPDLVTAQEEYLTALRGVDALGGASAATRERAERLVRSAERQLELLGVTTEQIAHIRQERRSSTRLTIYAPIGGTIVRKPAMEGMYVRTGDALYEIADLETVWILLDVYESDLPWIAPMQRVRITTSAAPGVEIGGQVAFIDPVVDPMSRTIAVRVNAMNGAGLLKPDMFVNAELFVSLAEANAPAIPIADGAFVCPMHPWETSDVPGVCSICGMTLIAVDRAPGYREPRAASEVLAVPREAVLQTGERSLVYLETRPGAYVAAEVDVGSLAEDDEGREYYPILSGLQAGERIVIRGNFAIDSQMQISGRPSLFGRAPIPPREKNDAPADSTSDMAHTDASTARDQADDDKQTICPVMGNEIDPEVFADIHGVRVWFCCPPCIERFRKDPEKYLPELPAALASKIRAAMGKAERRDD